MITQKSLAVQPFLCRCMAAAEGPGAAMGQIPAGTGLCPGPFFKKTGGSGTGISGS
jgi:hypothetical protein